MIIVKIQGGLGNQFFQYAAALQISKSTNKEVLLDLSYFDDEKHKILYRFDKFKVIFKDATKMHIPKEANTHFSRISQKLYYGFKFFPCVGFNVINGDLLSNPSIKLKSLNPKMNFLLIGWLQNTEYFKGVKTILSDHLHLNNNVSINKEISNLILNTNSVAIHIRRGDMLLNKNFVELDSVYYESAIKIISNKINNPHFFVFSDEPEKAKQLLKQLKYPLTFVTEHSQSLGYYSTKGDFIDFELMRRCKHYITANSTFSWWPAYLSQDKNKIVISPSKWYENKALQDKFEKSNLIEKDWIKI